MADMNQILRQLSNENTAKTFDFNRVEAEKARQFSADMSNTSHQREVADLKRAGLNPVLSANGGAQAYSASSASASADTSAVGALSAIYQTKMNNANAAQIAKQNNKISKEIAKENNNTTMKAKQKDYEIAKLNYKASKYASDKASSASKYASDNSKIASQYSADSSRSASEYHTNVSSKTSAGNTRYSTDRSKYGIAYNYVQGLTGYSGARTAGKKTQSLGSRVIRWIKSKF